MRPPLEQTESCRVYKNLTVRLTHFAFRQQCWLLIKQLFKQVKQLVKQLVHTNGKIAVLT